MYNEGPHWNPAERKRTQPEPSEAGSVGKGGRTERADIRRTSGWSRVEFLPTRGEKEQGSERSFRRKAERSLSGLCGDEVRHT